MAKKKDIFKPEWYQYAIHWLSQRRVWSAILSGAAAVCASLGYNNPVIIITLVAGMLGLHSFVKPKK